MKKKLLFFVSDFTIGQSALLTDQLLAISESGLQVVAVSGEGEQEKGLKDKTAHIDVRRVTGLDKHESFCSLAKQVSVIIREEKVDCVHVQNNWQMMLVVYAKFILLRKLSLRIIYTLHGFRHNHPLKSQIARIVIGTMLLLFASKVICMSSYLKEKFWFLGKKIALLPLGISGDYFLDEYVEAPQEGLQMVFPAQFRVGKNQDLLIRAFAKHIQKTADKLSHLTLPGDGELKGDMQVLVESLHIADRVSFPGLCSKKEVLQLYLNSNVGLVSSNSETFGQSIVEPFVLGRCVVSTHVGIANDILKNKKNGFFFSSEEELVEILGTLYNQPTLITEAGKQNYEKRKLFSWEEVTRHYVSVVENM